MKLKVLLESNIRTTLKDKYIDKDAGDVLTMSDGVNISLGLIKFGTKKTGKGTAFMNDLIRYADLNNKVIVLSPSKDFGGTVSRLIKFYKRFGFVENKGGNKDYEISETMYRLPQGK